MGRCDSWMAVGSAKDYMYYRGDSSVTQHDYYSGPCPLSPLFIARPSCEGGPAGNDKRCSSILPHSAKHGFFGGVNGRGCYCTHPLQAQGSDCTQYDAVCEGGNTLMCGGSQ